MTGRVVEKYESRVSYDGEERGTRTRVMRAF